MRFGLLLPSDTWMEADERRRFRSFVRRMAESIGVDQCAHDPMVQLQICDLGAILVHVERAETALAAGPDRNAAQESKALESAGKARERMRKAMKELQDYCATMATPSAGLSLAERLQPILARYPYILEGLPEAPSQNPTSGI